MAPKKKGKEEPSMDNGRPSTADPDDENPFVQLAKKYWLKTTSKKSTKVKVKPDVLKNEIWDTLEKEDFAFKSLLVLENLQILERYNCSRQVNDSHLCFLHIRILHCC
jgi:intron-binding protein aquarius